MSIPQMLRQRGPALAVFGTVAGVIFWQSRGANNQPVGHATGGGQTGPSEIMQGLAGTGGATARKDGPEVDPKNTQIASSVPSPTKKVADPPPVRKQPGVDGKLA